MLLDIRRLFTQPESAAPLAFSVDLSGYDFPGYQVQAPCEGVLTPTPERHARRLRLHLQARAVITAECARCLAPVQAELPLERTILVNRDGDNAQEELPLTAEGRLDVDELLYTEIMATAPVLWLCREDCPGLCPVCGRPRAQGCGCVADTAAT